MQISQALDSIFLTVKINKVGSQELCNICFKFQRFNVPITFPQIIFQPYHFMVETASALMWT